MTTLTMATEVAKIFSQKLHIDVPSQDSDLFETGVLDSLCLVELVFQLEQQFGVRILLGETDLEHFRSIEGIALMLRTAMDLETNPQNNVEGAEFQALRGHDQHDSGPPPTDYGRGQPQ